MQTLSRLLTQRCSGARACSRRQGGYTLYEILIVLGLIGILTAVVVARYRDFDSTTVLRGLAYEVALTVREAQVMAISTAFNVSDTSSRYHYGVRFSENAPSFETFVDRDEDESYDGSELVRLTTVSQNATIAGVCARTASGCTAVTTGTATFARPHLETTFTTTGASVSGVITALEITIRSRGGATRTVIVDRSGRIEVQ